MKLQIPLASAQAARQRFDVPVGKDGIVAVCELPDSTPVIDLASFAAEQRLGIGRCSPTEVVMVPLGNSVVRFPRVRTDIRQHPTFDGPPSIA